MKKITFVLAFLLGTSSLASCNLDSYTVTWKNFDGTILEVDKNVPRGAIPSYDRELPTRDEEESLFYSFKGWDKNIAKGIVEDTVFTAQYRTLHKFSITVNDDATSDLSFTTIDDQPLNTVKAYENRDFTFKVKSTNESCYVPSLLNIVVNNMGPLIVGTAYTMEFSTDNADYSEAKVTIKAASVVGDIIISGSGVESDKRNYSIYGHYGLRFIEDGSVDKDDDLIITFEPESSYKLPKAEDVFVYYDKEKGWVNPYKNSGFAEYNESNGNLTIHSSFARTNIAIIARAHEYNLLGKSSWNYINAISVRGIAPYVFALGEKKTISLYGSEKQQDIRIIDFNRDDLAAGGKAGITFDFVNTISDYITPWNNKTLSSTAEDFINTSNLNECLQRNGDVYEKMPDLMMKVVKDVTKQVDVKNNGQWTQKSYETKLFPLSQEEIDEKSSTKYQFFTKKSDRVKGLSNYWLRSPSKKEDTDAIYVSGGISILGGDFKTTLASYKYAVAPAFCV